MKNSPYKCDKCQLKFNTNNMLNEHKNTQCKSHDLNNKFDYITNDYIKEIAKLSNYDKDSQINKRIYDTIKENPNPTDDEKYELMIKCGEPNWDRSKNHSQYEDAKILCEKIEKCFSDISTVDLLEMINPEMSDTILKMYGCTLIKQTGTPFNDVVEKSRIK